MRPVERAEVVRASLKRMKNNKATEPGEILADAWRALGAFVMELCVKGRRAGTDTK